MKEHEAQQTSTEENQTVETPADTSKNGAVNQSSLPYDQLLRNNHALAQALTRAGEELGKTKSQLLQLARSPRTFATVLRVEQVLHNDKGVQQATVEIVSGSRRMIVPVAANVQASRLNIGSTVLLNENLVVVEQLGPDTAGQVRRVTQLFEDGRVMASDNSGNNVVLLRSADIVAVSLTPGDRILVDASARIALAVLPAEGDTDLVLEETPDVTFADIGGLEAQIERIRDAVQLPFLHKALFERYALQAPKGVLLYGPPGNGKTLIAKAVAHTLAVESGKGAGVFLSVKGPELLNKYVGESERLIRLIFKRARERAASGRPVIVFIDEMDSLLRTRGSGVSSDMETTIVPQFLAELDGVERLDNVMVIGASNRVDMIDPAVLRPGRLDVKIRVERPDETQAVSIVNHYLTDDLPLDAGVDAQTLSQVLVQDMYAREPRRAICAVTNDRGLSRTLYLSDVTSGAMLKNIVDRAKTRAVKASIRTGSQVALNVQLLAQAVEDEYVETRDSVLDADPAQWSRINGIEGGHVTRIMPLNQVQ